MRVRDRCAQREGGYVKRLLYVILGVLAASAGITFAIQNRQVIDVSYYFGLHWSGPLSLALLATFTAGIVVGYLVSLRTVIRMQRQLARARKEIHQVEQEVINLRSLPIKDVV
jgi:putative membrane protein